MFKALSNAIVNSLPLFLIGLIALRGSPIAGQEIQFQDVTREAGIYEPLKGIMGHGGAFGDFDRDGYPDLYVGGFADRPADQYQPAEAPVNNRLLRNLGNGQFARVDQAVVELYGRTSGAVFADLNNDGWLDLYVANNTKGRSRLPEGPRRQAQLQHANLFKNNQGTFADVSVSSGAATKSLRTTRNVGVFDYNQDGLLDLLVLEDRFIRDPHSALYRNLGKMKFQEVNNVVGLPDDLYGLGLAVADLNEDGRPDFFVGHSNRFFLSTKEGKYTEPPELRRTFAWEPLHNEDWPCGAAFGDLNRDGKLDMVLAIHSEQARNQVYLNQGLKNGVPQFQNVTDQVGLAGELTTKSPHVEIQDFNNDGWPDLYFSAAWLDGDRMTPLVYQNQGLKDGQLHFKAPRPIDEKMVYYSAGPSGDYDRDGRIDLFLVNWFRGNHSRLLRNMSPSQHWLQVQVHGKTINRMGIGSQIRIYPAGQLGESDALLGFQEVSTGYGYASGQEAICHFGLGQIHQVDLEITLPNGKTLQQLGVPANQRLVVKEPQN